MLGFDLQRDAYGRLIYTSADGEQRYEGVVPVRAFPITRPQLGLSLVAADGHELVWIEDLQALPAVQQELIEAELAGREFMPEIRRIVAVSTYATPSTSDGGDGSRSDRIRAARGRGYTAVGGAGVVGVR